jgi:hypothetical protein
LNSPATGVWRLAPQFHCSILYCATCLDKINGREEGNVTDSIPEPVIVDSMGPTVYRGMAVLAGMQLDLFTPLKDGPLSAVQIAASLGVEAVN